MIRGQCYRILRLHQIFKVHTEITRIHEGILVMVETDTGAVCIFADALIGEQQVVVKALPRYINKVKGLAGCTLLGDGNISLILDVTQLSDD
jgi:two-component system chemotaxis sensor kinase CheA